MTQASHSGAVTMSDWFNKFDFVSPLTEWGASIYYLGFIKATRKPIVIKQYIATTNELDLRRQAECFQDEVRLFTLLRTKGIVDWFDYHTEPGRFFLVFDVSAACQLVCSDLKAENVDRAIKSAGVAAQP